MVNWLSIRTCGDTTDNCIILSIQKPWASPGGGGGGRGAMAPPSGLNGAPPPPFLVYIHEHPHWLNWLEADSIHRPLVESAESADTSLTELGKSGQHPPPPPPPPHWLGQRIRSGQMAPPCPILPPSLPEKLWMPMKTISNIASCGSGLCGVRWEQVMCVWSTWG